MQAAIRQIEELIRAKYPEATFVAECGDDPFAVYLVATVDVEDTDDVVDLYVDRLVDLQLEHGLRLHVLPLRTPERIAALLREEQPVAVPG